MADQQRRECQSRVRAQGFAYESRYLSTARDKEGRSPLHYAAKVSKPLAFKLIQHKANVNARARNGTTPLHCAFQAQQLDIAVLLLNNGADITARDNERRLATDLAGELFVNEVHRRTRRRFMTADELSAQVSEEEVHEQDHVIEEIEEPEVTRVKPRASPRKHYASDEESAVSAQEEIELLRGALREAQRALEQSDSKKVQQAITLYKQAALTRKAEVDSMAVRMRELEAELHARDVEIRELKRRIEDMRANQRQSRGNTPSTNKRRRSTSASPRPTKRRRVSGGRAARTEEEEEDEEEEDVEEQVEEHEDDEDEDQDEDEDDSDEQPTPRVRTRSASKQQSSAQKTPRQSKSPTQPRSGKKSTGKQQLHETRTESSESSEDESSSSESAQVEQRGKNKKSAETKSSRRKSGADKTTEVSIVGVRDIAGSTEWRVSSAGGTKTWVTSAELKQKYGNKAAQGAINRYQILHSKKK